jgi:hypothetical protein
VPVSGNIDGDKSQPGIFPGKQVVAGWSLQEVADWQVLAKQKIAFLTYKSLLLLVVGRKNTCFF